MPLVVLNSQYKFSFVFGPLPERFEQASTQSEVGPFRVVQETTLVKSISFLKNRGTEKNYHWV